MYTVILGLLALCAALIIWGVVIYNRLVASSRQIQNAFSQIDVQLQRRYDLIPNLVETARAYMKHERDTLEAVVAARNHAARAAQEARDAPSPEAMLGLQGAESALGGALGRFFALAEAYPDLKADQNMARLQEELTSTESRIAFARQAYNDAVTGYNIQREIFPNTLIASAFGFRAEEVWKSGDGAVIRQNVRVNF